MRTILAGWVSLLRDSVVLILYSYPPTTGDIEPADSLGKVETLRPVATDAARDFGAALTTICKAANCITSIGPIGLFNFAVSARYDIGVFGWVTLRFPCHFALHLEPLCLLQKLHDVSHSHFYSILDNNRL